MKITKKSLIAVILLFLMINTAACAIESHMKNPIKTHHATLWQLVDKLIALPSFTLESVQYVLPVEFAEYQRRRSFSFYEGGPIRLFDQVIINTTTLAIEHKDGISSLIGFDLSPSGTCVTIEDVYAHYDNTEIIGAPRGGSLDEKTYWAVRYPWGRLAFGFKEGNRDCLASVGIRRNDASNQSKNSSPK